MQQSIETRTKSLRARRWSGIGLAFVAALLIAKPPAVAQTIGVPDVSGDQLIFVYDARTNRVPFLYVSNPSNDTVFVDVAFFPADLSSRLGGAVVTLGPAGSEIIDPTQFAGGVANGNGGLAVMTPVASADNLQAVVPPQPLTGGFTLANVALGSAFGNNPFGRLAVEGDGSPADPGAQVDGGSVSYERFVPDILNIPVYFNPDQLGPPENDGNRVLLVAFDDDYGVPFNVAGRTDSVETYFFNRDGQRIANTATQVDGVLLSDLQTLAGGTSLAGSSGKVFFDVDAGDGNVFGVFAQSVGTFAAGQLMPAVNLIPEGSVGPPPIECPGGTATITANVTSDQTWPSSCEIFLDGTIFVVEGVNLVIEAGTTVKGKKFPNNPPPTALVVRRGATLTANGTADSPIVFTSDQAEGQRAPGDWAGLALNGAAPVNCPGGECEAEGLVDTVFGGDNPSDTSGSMHYLRIEFAGRELAPDNELNLFTLNGVGAGSSIDHIQAHLGLDDGVEWFGGTVNLRYMVSTGAADDVFDWQIGNTGAMQFAYGAETGANIDTAGSNGFEGDNNEDGFDFTPRSDPKFCNVTLIGSKGQAGGDVSNRGALLRRGTAGQIANSILTQFNTSGIQMRDAATANNACNGDGTPTGALLFADTIFFNTGPDGTTFAENDASTEGANCQTTDLFAFWEANTDVRTTDPGFPAACANFGCTPIPTGDVSASFDCSSLDSFLTDTNYAGAFAPGQPAWTTSPWISFATN